MKNRKHFLILFLLLKSSTVLFGQDLISHSKNDSTSFKMYLVFKLINLKTLSWDFGTLDNTFDIVIKQQNSKSFLKQGMHEEFKTNDTIRNVHYTCDSKDALIENQIYQACLTRHNIANVDTTTQANTVKWASKESGSELCSELIVCNSFTTKDTLEGGNKIITTTTFYKKPDKDRTKYLLDEYSDVGYAVLKTTQFLTTNRSISTELKTYFQTGKLNTRVRKYKGVKKKTVWDENGKKIERSRSTYELPNRKKGFEDSGKTHIRYLRKDGKICFKKEVIYNYKEYEY